jgi:hypothetical protein
MSFSIPDVEPASQRAGETFHWTMSLPDFAPADGWSLTYYFSGPDRFIVTATTSAAGDFDCQITAAISTNYPAGRYRYSGIVTKGSESHEVRTGVCTITANLATASAGSQQSPNELMLAAIRARLNERATSQQLIESYGIHGRQVAKVPLLDLVKLEGIYAARVYREQHPGNPLGAPVAARFVLPS